jgi:hypothetical protein
VTKCPSLEALRIPQSFKKTISNSTKMFLDMKDVVLLEGDVWGRRKTTLAERMASQEPDFIKGNVGDHRKGIHEYSEISQTVYERIDQYRTEGLSADEIEAKLSRETKWSADLIRLILKKRS